MGQRELHVGKGVPDGIPVAHDGPTRQCPVGEVFLTGSNQKNMFGYDLGNEVVEHNSVPDFTVVING